MIIINNFYQLTIGKNSSTNGKFGCRYEDADYGQFYHQ